MSFVQGQQQAFTAPRDLDGSDGPAHQPRPQTQYAEEVVAHLAAARAALRQLSVASVEVLCSDPGLDPAYVGCMRELAGLGLGHGGKQGVVPGSIPGIDQHRKATLINEDDAWKDTAPSSIPGYVFTAHFFPRETYGRCARADRPSDDVLAGKMTEAMKENPTTAHITIPTRVSWTAHSDVTIRVPPDAIDMDELVRQINILEVMKRAFPSSFPAPQWATYRMRGDPPTCYLMIHEWSRIHTGNWESLSKLLHGIQDPNESDSWSTSSPRMTTPVYQLRKSFPIVGRKMDFKGEGYDFLLDLCGLGPATEDLRKACNNGFKMGVSWSTHSATRYYATSFYELKD